MMTWSHRNVVRNSLRLFLSLNIRSLTGNHSAARNRAVNRTTMRFFMQVELSFCELQTYFSIIEFFEIFFERVMYNRLFLEFVRKHDSTLLLSIWFSDFTRLFSHLFTLLTKYHM